MSDRKEPNDRSTPGSGRKSLSLKRPVDSGTLKQSLSHGRSRAVVVEKRRKRPLTAKGEAPAAVTTKTTKTTVVVAKDKAIKPARGPSGRLAPGRKDGQQTDGGLSEKSGTVLRTLTDEEKKARAQALTRARKQAEVDRVKAEEDAERRAIEEAARPKVSEAEAELPDQAGAEAKTDAPEVAEPPEAIPGATPERAPGRDKAPPTLARKPEQSDDEADDGGAGRLKRKTGAAKPSSTRRAEPKRRTSKLTVTNALAEEEERQRSLAAMRRAREREKRAMRGETHQPPQKVVREVTVPEVLTIKELAERMAVRAVDVIKVMMKQGSMVTASDVIDADTAQLLAEEFGHTVKRIAESDVELGLYDDEQTDAELAPRAPVVTVMGHVDHGKTSLLDALRKTDVVSGEAGGITQHIGAYQVTLESGDKISFLDTPGHAAFTAMRARGAKVTDIVILVVAGDDGVMPQTIEAINHAKAAHAPIIVAINKMDKPDSDAARVKQELLQHELITEEFGGDIQTVEVSALKGTGLSELTAAIMLQAEILELKANPNRQAIGTVIEAKLDRGRGPVATLLIQSGTLRVGDIFVAGSTWGRVRALNNDKGDTVEEAGPSVPVEVLGLGDAPLAGDDAVVVDTEARAREISDYRQRKARDVKSAAETQQRGSLEQMLQHLKESDTKEYPVVIKGDVQGSVEAILGTLENLSTDEVKARAIHHAVGGVTESDVVLAHASNAPIIAFNVRANVQAREHAQRDNVEIRYYSVIYQLVDDVKAAMSGLLSPTMRETFLGNAEILEVFNITKVGRVAGCRVSEGLVRRGARVRLIRDNVVIHEGKLSTLKRFKDEVREVQSGQECGMAFENYQDLQKGDVIECFEVEEVARSL